MYTLDLGLHVVDDATRESVVARPVACSAKRTAQVCHPGGIVNVASKLASANEP